MTRVLHVINEVDVGGAQTLVENLARHREVGQEVHVLTLLAGGALEPRVRDAADSLTTLGLTRSPGSWPTAVGRLRRFIARLAPDVVHSHLLQGNVAGYLGTTGTRVGHVMTIHTSGFSDQDPALTRLLARLIRFAPSATEIVACTEEAAQFMAAQGVRSGVTIPNGVARPSGVARYTVDGPVLHVARWHPMKGHPVLFRACAAVPQARVICVGPGVSHDDPECSAALRASGARNVHLVGPSVDVARRLATASALVISSTYGEALPMVGLEALVRGVPVITTDVGGCHRLAVEPWQVVKAADPEALASALRHWTRLPAGERRSLSERSSALGQQYSVESAVSGYADAYRRSVGRQGVNA